MTRAHRTAHAWMWLVLAGVLGTVFGLALSVKPTEHPANDIPEAALAASFTGDANGEAP